MKKSVKGFLIAPIVPAIVFVVFMAGMGIISLFTKGKLLDFIAIPFIPLAILYWLLYVLPVSFFLSFLFGIPMYLVFDRIGLISLTPYIIGSSVAGVLSGLFSALYLRTTDSFPWTSFWIFGGGIFGAITGYSFWSMVYGGPNNIFERFFSRVQSKC